jgi:hypothetical protein
MNANYANTTANFNGRYLMRLFQAICTSSVLLGAVAFAQTAVVAAKPLNDSEIQLMRSNVQADKNEIIGHTMKFTDTESGAFWPVYRDYARDQQVIGDQRVQLVKDYALSYDSMDDTKAKDMVQRMMDIENKTLTLREDYWPRFKKALGGRRAAKFYQVDTRLSLIVTLQLTAEIPLIP